MVIIAILTIKNQFETAFRTVRSRRINQIMDFDRLIFNTELESESVLTKILFRCGGIVDNTIIFRFKKVKISLKKIHFWNFYLLKIKSKRKIYYNILVDSRSKLENNFKNYENFRRKALEYIQKVGILLILIQFEYLIAVSIVYNCFQSDKKLSNNLIQISFHFFMV
jgi:hypothetical protein